MPKMKENGKSQLNIRPLPDFPFCFLVHNFSQIICIWLGQTREIKNLNDKLLEKLM